MALWNDVGTRYIQETITPGEGVDTFRSPLQISAGQASDMQDFSSRNYPALKTREGRKQILPPLPNYPVHIHASPISSNRVHTIYHALVVHSGIYSQWYACTDLSATLGLDWTLIDDDGLMIGQYDAPMADWYDFTTKTWFAYCIRPSDVGQYNIVYTNITTTGAIAYATYPCKAGPMCSHGNRMFATPLNAAGNLGYSKLADPSVWTSPDGGILPVGGNDNIKVLLSMPDRLFIGTDRGIYVLFGDDEDNYQLVTVTNDIFVPSGRHATMCGKSVFFSDGKDVYEYSGSGGINNITRDPYSGRGGFAEGSLSIEAMGSNGVRVYCSNKRDGQNFDFRVYDTERKRWYIESGSADAWDDTPVFAKDSDGGMLMTRFGIGDANGDDIVNYENPIAIMKVDSTLDGDSVNQHNLLIDPNATAVTAWTPFGGAESIDGGYYTVTGDGSVIATIGYQAFGVSYGYSETVFGNVMARVTNANCTKLFAYFQDSASVQYVIGEQLNPTANTWYNFYAMVPLGANTGALSLRIRANYADAGTANGKKMQFTSCVADNTFLSYGYNINPSITAYTSELTFDANTGYYFQHLNPTSVGLQTIDSSYTSPAFQIRPSAKKTLANIWISVDATKTTNLYVDVSNELDSTNFTNIYTMPSLQTSPTVTRIKVPISYAQKSEWIRFKVWGVGQLTILNITLDWRVVERVR